MSKSLVFIDDFSKEEIYEIFKLADKFADDMSQLKPLEGKTVVLFFPESSIRTRVTFESFGKKATASEGMLLQWYREGNADVNLF